jgi:hypothetical protein
MYNNVIWVGLASEKNNHNTKSDEIIFESLLNILTGTDTMKKLGYVRICYHSNSGAIPR